MEDIKCEGENDFRTTSSGWSGIFPVCTENFIEVKDIEIPSNENINDYKVIFKADDVKQFNELFNLIDQDQRDNKDTDIYFINYTKEGIYKIPFYAVVEIVEETKKVIKLLKVKFATINKTTVSNYNVEIIDNKIPKSSGSYPTLKLYVLKTDIKSLKQTTAPTSTATTPPPPATGGRKSRRTINRKRRAVRKRRNTKRYSKTYRR
jgi:hypothetical protein